MSADAWGAFLASLWDAVQPIAMGAWGGWMLRGAVDARRRSVASPKASPPAST